MNLTITTDAADLRRQLREFSDRRFRSAMATALTRTAVQVGKLWTQQLATRIDRPTPTTLRAVQTKRAENRDANPVAEVRIRTDARGAGGTAPAEWLAPQELGGPRRLKKFEQALQRQGSMPAGWRAVPGPAATRDTYGNVSRSQIIQVVAQLGAQYSPGYARVIGASAQRRAARAARLGRAYVAIPPGNIGKLTPGVYERTPQALRPIFYFVRGTVYQRQLDLVRTAQRDTGGILKREVQRAVAESAARLAQRGPARA